MVCVAICRSKSSQFNYKVTITQSSNASSNFTNIAKSFTQNSVFCAEGIEVQFIVDMNTFYTHMPNDLCKKGSVLDIPYLFKMIHSIFKKE